MALVPGHVDLTGPTSRDQDGVLHSSKSQTPSGGVLRSGDSSPGRSSHEATSKKGTSGSLSSHVFTPTGPHPGDSEGKYKSPPVTEVAALSPTYVQGSNLEVIPLGLAFPRTILPWSARYRVLEELKDHQVRGLSLLLVSPGSGLRLVTGRALSTGLPVTELRHIVTNRLVSAPVTGLCLVTGQILSTGLWPVRG